jgi:membrane protein
VPAAGWLDILARTKQQISEDNLSIVGAGVAFYAFVAVVPALAAIIAIYGLISDPSSVAAQIEAMARVLPQEVLPLLHEQMLRITSNHQAAGFGALIGFAFALYSCGNAVKALISGLNIAYEEQEHRGFFKLTGLAILLTVGAVVGAVLAVALVAFLPNVLKRLDLSGNVETLLNVLRWPLLVGGFMTALAVVYRYGPCRNDAKWRWVSPGAILAALLWLLASGAFSFYCSHFASYDKTYGPLGTVVIFMMWLFLSAFVILLGAEMNSELERQTMKDSTDEPPKPLGQRGATAADTVGPSRDELREAKKQ